MLEVEERREHRYDYRDDALGYAVTGIPYTLLPLAHYMCVWVECCSPVAQPSYKDGVQQLHDRQLQRERRDR